MKLIGSDPALGVAMGTVGAMAGIGAIVVGVSAVAPIDAESPAGVNDARRPRRSSRGAATAAVAVKTSAALAANEMNRLFTESFLSGRLP